MKKPKKPKKRCRMSNKQIDKYMRRMEHEQREMRVYDTPLGYIARKVTEEVLRGH